ncbi:MAG: UpxY family transcription antiterminator [Bacteroidetes bacterium]|nr:UpxY family transcription antiterminator [Bacteroidota bacterium]
MSNSDLLTWKVVYVSSRQEKKVARDLEKSGIENYVPIARQLRQWSDRKKWVEIPMFSGYVFVKPDLLNYDRVLQSPGVVCYLTFEGKAATVKDREIEIIKSIESSGYFAETMHTPEDFEEGEKVLVVEGPLKGQTVDLVRKNNENIFLVAFDTLGQSIKINLPFETLQKIKEEV